MTTIKQLFANLIMEINETFEKIYQAAEENKIFESVYNEFGKLNSLEEKLSPKLKALLAAGLIGTASLGMQSCAQPTDDYDTYIVNPGDTKKEDDNKKEDDTYTEVTVPAPTDNTTPAADNNNEEKNGRENTVEETEEQKWAKTPFGQLGVSKEHAEKLSNAEIIDTSTGAIYYENAPTYKYTGDIKKGGFEEITADVQDFITYKTYSDGNCVYNIPADKAKSFNDAIADYKKK